MHEMSIAVAVVEQVEEAAARLADGTGGAPSAESVHLEVGELAGVVADALAFSFDLACTGTVLEGAALITETVPGRARCARCARDWPTGMPPRLSCPGCDGAATELLAGRELRITEVRWAEQRRPVATLPEER
ncbi:hydrogenase maturation nickel metallochaperone HypA [Actinacidiphila glaucinigra]|uniref:hydrogenase maturation nickel metallochaperone HypA/HybF n=1 Tax=Actinacidiphila glaucinigra TaxID=235986 RepID=UPI002DD8C370|nr:hydrogenase maturation nickel metallochaperone HypA [Actinacidiphila glaucinigra]WSD64098.1 hydrogenase maturation nickel metallochaperone HypA [Actinacidiphila glaucinigra]